MAEATIETQRVISLKIDEDEAKFLRDLCQNDLMGHETARQQAQRVHLFAVLTNVLYAPPVSTEGE